ncbi:MAG: hypothetical protein U0175_38755 [Caldilineaceae bacterium]
MNKQLNIKICPNCGSDQIAKVCCDWQGKYRGKVYIVPKLEFYECPVCDERVFPPEAIAKIREYSPAYGKRSKAPLKEPSLPAVPA